MKIFADTADVLEWKNLDYVEYVDGFTTNPSLMRAAGVTDYATFGPRAMAVANGRPVSFEVTCEGRQNMVTQALRIAEWGDNAYVKIPIIDPVGEFNTATIEELVSLDIKVNVTAVFSREQAAAAMHALRGAELGIISVFAGRIGDAGHDPYAVTQSIADQVAATYLNDATGTYPRLSVLWASARQAYDVQLAQRAGCSIITLPPALITKRRTLVGKDLDEFSRETAQQFYIDAYAAGLTL